MDAIVAGENGSVAGVVVKGEKRTGRGSEFRWWGGSIGS